ncbi:putative junctional adhesion molecule A [Scophthalmus maximus]|uniref:Junctional adhesion molecule A n=1 Tax=Scophthalmus maximus TaxID=52904 RepID=A0A2U9B8A6_SCOMX|nr:F11 receptor, tandem duplicate 1 [Scophthalmus maximus]AWP00175.1 putative junctional adhesion molecule A [Scophthalmus maximus]QVG60687.1 jamA-like protein [Scophthalmus maximus]QXG57895.1 junctional adhesion molecule-1 [Scophthalmus maximus]
MLVVSGLVSLALFLCAASGVSSFLVTTKNADVRVKENEGTDLTCDYSGDFGSNARVEWKFKDLKGSQTYVVFDGKPTTPYSSRVTMYGSNLRFSKMTRDDNGVYDCEVSGNSQFGEVRVKVTVLVPPSVPLCRIPSSVTTDRTAHLSCHDSVGSPPPKYRWFRGGTLLPPEPSKITGFKNYTYKLNTENGNLEFTKATKMDTGTYYCEAYNDAGPPKSCKAVKMEVRDLNTGGIVAGVIVLLLLVALLGFGLWYANKKGYLPKKKESKPKSNVVYQPPSLYGGEDEDGEFKQKSSFVV